MLGSSHQDPVLHLIISAFTAMGLFSVIGREIMSSVSTEIARAQHEPGLGLTTIPGHRMWEKVLTKESRGQFMKPPISFVAFGDQNLIIFRSYLMRI
jgi:hypothetical protein